MSLDNKKPNGSTLTALQKLKRLSHHNYGLGSVSSSSLPEEPEFTFRTILEGTLGQLKFAFEKKVKEHTPELGRMHCVIAHAPAHAKWADHLTSQLTESVLDILPDTDLTLEPLVIDGTLQQVTKTLTDYVTPYGPDEFPGHIFIVTLGWRESQMITAAKSEAGLSIPQLFCVPGMSGQMFNNKDAMLNPHLIGGVANTLMSPENYVHSIQSFKEDAELVCIAYDPNPGNEVMAQHVEYRVKDIEAALKAAGLRTRLHHWTPEDMGEDVLEGALTFADSAIILDEPAAHVHRIPLIQMCNRLQTFICSSELDTVLAGAALGCGVTGSTFGIPLARLLVHYLLDPERGLSWAVYQIPEQSGMRFNEWAFGLQGVELNARQQVLLRMKSAFDPSCIEL